MTSMISGIPIPTTILVVIWLDICMQFGVQKRFCNWDFVTMLYINILWHRIATNEYCADCWNRFTAGNFQLTLRIVSLAENPVIHSNASYYFSTEVLLRLNICLDIIILMGLVLVIYYNNHTLIPPNIPIKCGMTW